MNWLDYFLILVVGLSTLLAAMRGFVGEVISLVGWLVAFTLSSRFSGRLEPYLADHISNPTMLGVVSFVLVFIGVLIVMGLIGHLIKLLVGGAGLTFADRSLGMIFGLARGALLVTVGFMILLAVSNDPPSLVRQSSLSPHFMSAAQWLGRSMPDGSALLDRIHANYEKVQGKATALDKQLQQPLGATLVREAQRALAPEDKAKPPPKPTAPADKDVKELDNLFLKYNTTP